MNKMVAKPAKPALQLHPSPRQKWDKTYASLSQEDRRRPTPFVSQCLPQLPTSGRALDIAAGAGRHTLALAQHGLQVDAVDISRQGILLAHRRIKEANPVLSEQVQFIIMDIERGWLPRCRYDVIIVSFFLHRPLFPLIKQQLNPGGLLLYETFTLEHKTQSRYHKHSSPDFFLNPNELSTAFSELNILIYNEGNHNGRYTARLLARNNGEHLHCAHIVQRDTMLGAQVLKINKFTATHT